MLLEALSTVNRFTRRWHKRYFRICAAVGAFDFRHLPRGTVTSIPITHFVFHHPYSLVIRKTILAAIIGTGLTALPSSTQVRSPVYYMRNTQDHYKKPIPCPSYVLSETRMVTVRLKQPFFVCVRASQFELLVSCLLGGGGVLWCG